MLCCRTVVSLVVTGLALTLSAALSAGAQEAAPPPADQPAAEAPVDPLAAARERQEALAVEAARTKADATTLIGQLERERDSLAAELEAAPEDARAGLEAARARVERRLALAQERLRAADALLVAQRRLVSILETRSRRETEGAAALGITPPTSEAEIEAALAALDDARAGLVELERAVSDAQSELTARAGERTAAATAREEARATLDALAADAPEREAAAAALTLQEEELATAALRHALAETSASVARLRHEEARAAVTLREAALEAADAEAVAGARERMAEARERAELEAEARRREEEERARDELARMRSDAAIEAEAARAALEDVRTPEVRRLLRLRIENAERTGALADLEERRREVEARLSAAKEAWTAELEQLDARRAEAAAGAMTADAIALHLAEVQARRDEADGDELAALQQREENASESAEGYRAARDRADEALAAFEAEELPAGNLRRSTRKELERAARVTAALFEAARDAAWAFDRLAELQQDKLAVYAAHLEDPAFDVLILGNSREQLWRAGAFVLGTLALGLLVAFLLRLLLAFTRTTRFTFDEYVVRRLAGPARLAVYLGGFRLVLGVLTMPETLRYVLETALSVLIVINIVYAVYNLVDVIIHALEPVVRNTESRLDDQLLPLVGKIGKLLVIVFGVVEGARVFGYNLTTVLAGVGVGGIAVALAARDTVANLFGSIMIFTDKPFEIGDWVKLPDCEGVVEGIGLRSTRIRTWEDTVVTIPNSAIGSASIENVSRFKSRRFKLDLGLRYDTPVEKVTRAVEIVRAVLDERDDIKEGYYVFFNDLRDSTLNVMMYCFVKFTVWRQYLTCRQDVTLEIMRRFEAEGIRFAFPTRTVELEAHGATSPATLPAHP